MVDVFKTGFFKDIAAESGVDWKTCKEIYFAMLKVLIRTVTSKKKITVPYLGTFKISTLHPRVGRYFKGKNNLGPVIQLPPVQVIKYIPSKRLRVYIRDKFRE